MLTCYVTMSSLHRILDGPDKGAWYHPYFLKGKPSALARVKRTAIKGKGTKNTSPSLSNMAPNFYEMPPIDIDTPAEAMKAMEYRCSTSAKDSSAHDYSNNLTTVDGSALNADGAVHQGFASVPMIHFPVASSSGQETSHMFQCSSSMLLNPVLAVQMPTWSSTSYFTGHPIPQFTQGQVNLHVPLKSDTEGIGLVGLANQDLELNHPFSHAGGIQTQIECKPLKSETQKISFTGFVNQDQVPHSGVIGADNDLVTKALRYAFKDSPTRQNFSPQHVDSTPHMTQSSMITSVQLASYRHEDANVVQRNNLRDDYSLGAQQHQLEYMGLTFDDEFSFHPTGEDVKLSDCASISSFNDEFVHSFNVG